MLNIITQLILTLAIVIILLFITYLVITIIKIYLNLRKINYRSHGFKFKFKHFLYNVKFYRFIKIVDFCKWVIIDIFKGKDKFKLFGIWSFTGYFGQGKTLGAVKFAKSIQDKYPNKKISIFTNFNMKGQNGKITKWEDLLNLPKNTIVIFDEIQSTFTSQKFKDFPLDLLWKITQCRKHSLAVFCTSPVFNRMSIQLRENTDYVIECKNVLDLDRWFRYSFYHADEYEAYKDNPNSKKLKKVMDISFIANDHDYRLYNTHEIVQKFDISCQSKETTKNTFSVNEQKKDLDDIVRIVKKEVKKDIKKIKSI